MMYICKHPSIFEYTCVCTHEIMALRHIGESHTALGKKREKGNDLRPHVHGMSLGSTNQEREKGRRKNTPT